MNNFYKLLRNFSAALLLVLWPLAFCNVSIFDLI